MLTTILAHNIEQYNDNKEQYQLILDQKNILKLESWKGKTSNQANCLTCEGILTVKTNNTWVKILKGEK